MRLVGTTGITRSLGSLLMHRMTWRDLAVRTDLEQATLRIRLAATALGATILVLVPGHDQVAAASLLIGYATVALVVRAWGARIGASGWIGMAMDVLFATGLSILLPLSAAWVLYLFAIGIAALRSGVSGLSIAAAGSVVSYDVVLAVRGGDALATDLWRIQVLLAFAVLAAELVWVAVRTRAEQRELLAYSLAQRDLAAAREADDLLDRLVDHAVRSFGASAAWVEPEDGSHPRTPRHARGPVDRAAAAGQAIAIPLARGRSLHVSFDDADDRVRAEAALRDLAADTRPLLEAADERVSERTERAALRQVLDAVHRIAGEMTRAGVLAQAITCAQESAGPAAIVRLADGERAVGDLDAEIATAIARDGVPPRLVSGGPYSGGATDAAAVTVGRGLVLVALGTRRSLEESDLIVLTLLGDATAAALERVTERGILVATAAELRQRNEALENGLRQRDDAVASAVHELRNPLTSVQAYGQLMARHLTAVQRQVTQLDSIIDDLLRVPAGSPPRALGTETADVRRETAEAANRLRVSVPDSEVRVAADAGSGPYEVRIDTGRLAQVLDNVLRNAAKYSRPGAAVEASVSRSEGEVLIAISDSGDGIAREDLERIFERYARGAQHAGSIAGAGIGLAISREIVTAHGGRIWAESAGIGKGSTFTVALPVATAAPSEQRASGGTTAR